jgi:hypothetical protein
MERAAPRPVMRSAFAMMMLMCNEKKTKQREREDTGR